MEFLILLPALLLILGYSPYLYLSKRSKPIDPLKYPTLSRAHRIIRVRNVKAREKDLLKKVGQAKRETAQIESKAKHDSAKNLMEVRRKYTAEAISWDQQWSALIAPEVAAQQAAALEAQRKEDEKRRQSQIADAKALRERTAREYREELERREALGNVWAISRSGKYDDSSYGDRIVSVHSVNLRRNPNTFSQKIGVRTQYEKVSVDAWAVGEEHYGNNVWFRLKDTNTHSIGWVWSGSLNNQSTSGLQNLSNTSLRHSFSSISGGTITADRISVGSIASSGGLTAPTETVYDVTVRQPISVSEKELAKYISARREYAGSPYNY